MGGRRIQVRPAIGGSGFIDFSERDRADQHSIALEKHEIGGHHQLGTAEHLAIAEVPDDLGRNEVQLSQLPSNWRGAAAPPELTGFGDEFMKRGEQCMLVVPSALAPHEHNWLLNPEHQDLKRSVIRELEPLAYDPRLFAKPPRRSRR